MGQFQIGVNADRTADGGAPRNHLDRRMRIGESKDMLVGTMKRLRQDLDAAGAKQPIRLDCNIDLPHLMQISRLDQKIDVNIVRRRTRSFGKRHRLPAQIGDDRCGAIPVELCGAGHEHAAILPRDIRNRRTECAECCADFRNDQLLAAEPLRDR